MSRLNRSQLDRKEALELLEESAHELALAMFAEWVEKKGEELMMIGEQNERQGRLFAIGRPDVVPNPAPRRNVDRDSVLDPPYRRVGNANEFRQRRQG